MICLPYKESKRQGRTRPRIPDTNQTSSSKAQQHKQNPSWDILTAYRSNSSAAAVIRPGPNYCQLLGNYTILVESTLRSFVSSESPLGSAQTLKPSSGMCSTGAPGQLVGLLDWWMGGVGGEVWVDGWMG
ncbi:hypothetical protein PAAG_04782 [Paracoccidioides lutzii Pb01]|uniref:Uncharacterized protein n=1 Tax=Paracoccidioides lutzii (strain ATCC MYA-826 / Pb01) TaxID=502779 RepID=C1H2F3_PARBA|nr:hypothetical protein PAAG_04782 [Paracoccidioides lutzii Pb01]EEH33733.1 hypothetical protein PAAG_04782 [Paracoccidioides lutzii Pb01]